jgi:hypothetical protein
MRFNKAYDLYNQGQTVEITKGVPRSKYVFTASLSHIGTTGTALETLNLDKIASVTMPGWSSASTTLNSYNRKRVVQTNYDYSPITLVAYDTRDPAAIESFLKNYSNYYYAGPMNVNNQLDHIASSKGFKLQESRNFIKTLDIVRMGSKTDINNITIYNPFITDIQADNLDYSDSQLVQYRLTFVYEGFDIRSTNSGQ